MRHDIGAHAFAIVCITVWLLPVAAGLFDGACWFVVAHQCTVIPWGADDWLRVGLVIFWSCLLPMLAFCFI